MVLIVTEAGTGSVGNVKGDSKSVCKLYIGRLGRVGIPMSEGIGAEALVTGEAFVALFVDMLVVFSVLVGKGSAGRRVVVA